MYGNSECLRCRLKTNQSPSVARKLPAPTLSVRIVASPQPYLNALLAAQSGLDDLNVRLSQGRWRKLLRRVRAVGKKMRRGSGSR